MTQLLDILGATIIGGFVLFMIARSNLNISEYSDELLVSTITQFDVVESIEIIESDDSYMEGYPDYSDESDSKSILNDHRRLLYLNPLMVLDENLQYSFDFYTPDVKGEYVITIQGMVGIYPVVKRIVFEVK